MMMTKGINTTNAEWRECKFAEFGVHLVSVKRIGKLNHSAIQDHPAVLRLKHVRWLVVS